MSSKLHWTFEYSFGDSGQTNKVKVASVQSTKWITRRAPKSGIDQPWVVRFLRRSLQWFRLSFDKTCQQIWQDIKGMASVESCISTSDVVFVSCPSTLQLSGERRVCKKIWKTKPLNCSWFLFTGEWLLCCDMSSQLNSLVKVVFSEVRYDESTDSPRNRKYGYAWPSECGQLTRWWGIRWHNPKRKGQGIHFDSKTRRPSTCWLGHQSLRVLRRT